MNSAGTGQLAELLATLDRDPAQLVEDLRRARESALGDRPEAVDLDLAELEFLRRCARDPRHVSLRGPANRARQVSLAAGLRRALAMPPGEPEALFDLAELRAEARLLDLGDLAEEALRARDERLASISAVSERLRFVAGERWVELSTEEEDFSLRQKVVLLEEMAELFAGLARRTGDRVLRRLARRTRNAAVDRELQLRVERVLTPTGAMVLETTSLLALLAVFVLLAVQVVHGDEPWIPWVDVGASLFFVAEFLFKLSLAPERIGWFARNAATDLLPALAAGLWFVDVPGGEAIGLARSLRFLRVVWIARYVQAMRPLIAVVRLLLFMVRGFDTVVRRFSRILNRDFVFFERFVQPLPHEAESDPLALAFRALRREHVLLGEMPVRDAAPILERRAADLTRRLEQGRTPRGDDRRARGVVSTRDIPIEHAIEHLWRLRPSDLATWLPRRDVLALDRVVRILNARPVCWLPVIASLRSPRVHATPEERVVDFGRRVALVFERWSQRALHFADLHGIVTGPQVLDRVASAIVKASQRPAIRLLLFGGLFTLVKLVLGAQSSVGGFLARFVATPLVILGGACLVFLALGRWLKALAGEAADAFRLTSEVHFLNLTEIVKQRHESGDLAFLAERVYRGTVDSAVVAGRLASLLEGYRTGRGPTPQVDGDLAFDARLQRTALLYLDFLDGAPLHETDVQTTEQLLANLSLQNIRGAWLGGGRRERKRLRSLSLVDGSLFRGPYLWFQFVTESVSVETAKLVTDWNRNCLTRDRARRATAEQRRQFAAWLRDRRRLELGRVQRTAPPAPRERFSTTEFHALDFVAIDANRTAHLVQRFGRGVIGLLERDRERMIREIFGTRPLHDLPRAQRSFNFVRFWEGRLSRGRVFLAPLYFVRVFLGGIRMLVARVVQIVREILRPETAARTRERGRAPFSVALRKIGRMKAPGLIESMRLRASVDPAYVGMPEGWSSGARAVDDSELRRDMEFLQLRERDAEFLFEAAARVRRRTEEFFGAVQRGEVVVTGSGGESEQIELAATVSYVTDRDHVRTLLRAEQVAAELIARADSDELRLAPRFFTRACAAAWRGLRRHPVDVWLRERIGRKVPVRTRGNLVRMWHAGDEELRRTVDAWLAVAPGTTPADAARRRLADILAESEEIVRDLAALRAVQSLSVLDVRNYRSLVFELGNYGADGESDALARALP
ncbi:MAG: hypothetical protein U1F36_19230 [Planctomycetota bacterium]